MEAFSSANATPDVFLGPAPPALPTPLFDVVDFQEDPIKLLSVQVGGGQRGDVSHSRDLLTKYSQDENLSVMYFS